MLFYKGPSKIDGQPIIAIATIGSKNPKTGPMIQTWIMRSDIEPHHAIKTGADVSVCGQCPHRPAKNGSCYVTTFQAPLSVFRAYHRGSYDNATIDQFQGLPLRMGSYGDPLAVPLAAWKKLLDVCNGHTGYTHQWQSSKSRKWRELVMASCDTEREADLAASREWRYFRVTEASNKQKGEVVCPASDEGGHKLSCADCLAGSGNTRNGRGIVIEAHGSRANRFNNHLIARAS